MSQASVGEALQICLEAVLSGQETVDSVLINYPDQAEELQPALESALWVVEERGKLEPRPGFVLNSRRRLVEQIRIEKLHPINLLSAWFPPFHLSRRKWSLTLASLVLLLVSLLTMNEVALASYLSIPGDATYTVKTTLEQIRAAVTLNGPADVHIHVSMTEQRISEIISIILEGRYSYLPQTVREFQDELEQSLDSLEKLSKHDPVLAGSLAANFRRNLINQTQVISVLVDMAPAEYHQAAVQIIQATAVDIERLDKLSPGVSTPAPQQEPAGVQNTPIPDPLAP